LWDDELATQHTAAGRTIVGVTALAKTGVKKTPYMVDLITQTLPYFCFAEAYMQDDAGIGTYHNDPINVNEVIVCINHIYHPDVPLLKQDKYHADYTTFGHVGEGGITVWPANRITEIGKEDSYRKYPCQW